MGRNTYNDTITVFMLDIRCFYELTSLSLTSSSHTKVFVGHTGIGKKVC